MSIRSSVETHSRALEPLLLMSLPNSLWWWDHEQVAARIMSIRSSVGTHSRALGPLLAMSLPNSLQCCDLQASWRRAS